MYILALSAYYRDSAACVLKYDHIIAAAQEESFTCKKHNHNILINIIKYCLKEVIVVTNNLEILGFYDNPFPKFEKILENYLSYSSKGISSFLKA